jgi:hypothetical protein
MVSIVQRPATRLEPGLSPHRRPARLEPARERPQPAADLPSVCAGTVATRDLQVPRRAERQDASAERQCRLVVAGGYERRGSAFHADAEQAADLLATGMAYDHDVSLPEAATARQARARFRPNLQGG